MGQIEAYKLLTDKGKICSKDLQKTFNMTQSNAALIMKKLLKRDEIGELLEMKKRKDGAPYAVRYATIKK